MKRLLLQIFAWLAILVGAGLMLQPTVSQYLTRRKSTAAVETFVQSAAVAADDPAAENTRPYADLYDALQAYNAEIYAEGQSGLKDPFAYETPAFDLTAYGLPDDMIAALWVPRLDLDLPVYLGASTENMARGGALLGQTSMPLGGANTNTVIAAHRGYYGPEYDGHSWQPADAEQFDNAAASWKTDGDSRLAIANLPFLRAAYDGAAPQQMTVQRLHADDTYTFAPYNAYFNDYYRLNGDGAAAGQTAQDDTFYYFPRGEAKTLLTARADADPSVLDRLESAYAAYAESRYLATPDGADYGTLQEFCNAAEKEHKLTGDADAIRTFVRSYLNEHCTYTSDPPQPADGADPVLYFLNESHAGSSTQFASAAAVLAALAVWGIARARRTPADTVRAEFRALYKKMCRCGLSEGVSSDQEEFKQFLREHTKTAAPQDVETLLALVQTAQFAPGPVSAQTAQQVRGLCRILRKNLHR